MMLNMEQMVKWLAVVAGILGLLVGMAHVLRVKFPAGNARVAKGYFVWPNVLSAVIVLLAVVGFLTLRQEPPVPRIWVASALIVGWALAFGIFTISRTAGSKLSSDLPPDGTAQSVGYRLLSGSGFIACSVALLGAAVFLMAVLPRPNLEVTAPEILIPLSLGLWVMVAFWSLPSAVFRGLLAQEHDAVPGDLGPLCVRFRSAPGEIAFLTASALSVAAAMGAYRYTDRALIGTMTPFAAFAAALLFGLAVAPMLAPRSSGRAHLMQALGMTIFLVGTGLAMFYLAVSFLGRIEAFYCLGIGLATAMLLIFTSRYRPPFVSPGTPFGAELAVAQVLALLAAMVLSFRWLHGYGVALCTVGLFSSAVILYPLGALWGLRRARELSEDSVDLPFVAHAASRFAEIVLAGGSFLLVVSLLRLYYQRAYLGSFGVDITDLYPLVGLVIGGSFPTLLRAVTLSEYSGRRASLDRSVLTLLGRWAAVRTLGVWLLAGTVPLLVAFFWRAEAVGAFLVGLAVAEFFLILTLWLGEAHNNADEGLRYATRATHVLVIGSALIASLLAPPLLDATDLLTRIQKVWALAGVFSVFFIWVMVVVLRRGAFPHSR